MQYLTSIPEAAAAVGPYSLATVEGNIVETAGQVALTPEGTLLCGTISEETHQVMRNLEAILGTVGCSFANVTAATIYYTDRDSFGEINEAYAHYFPSGKYPARATVGVAFLPLRDARVEISMRAVRPDAS